MGGGRGARDRHARASHTSNTIQAGRSIKQTYLVQEPRAPGLAVRHLRVVLGLHLGQQDVDADARDVEDRLHGGGHLLGGGVVVCGQHVCVGCDAYVGMVSIGTRVAISV